MIITEISRTKSFGEYENISMTAKTENGESVHAALLALEATIDDAIAEREAPKKMVYDIQELERRHASLMSNIETLKQRKTEIEAWFKKYGIPENKWGSIPF